MSEESARKALRAAEKAAGDAYLLALAPFRERLHDAAVRELRIYNAAIAPELEALEAATKEAKA